MKARIYEVWAWKAPYSYEPEGWSRQSFTLLRDAKEYMAEQVAEEQYIEVYEDSHWENDHIVRKLLRTITT